MKLTKSKLKQIIREELKVVKEAEITPEEFAALSKKVDPETFEYREEMEAIKHAMDGLRRDVRWELLNNRNLRVQYENNPSAGPMTDWAERLVGTILETINKRHDAIKKSLVSIVSKKVGASEAAGPTMEDEP